MAASVSLHTCPLCSDFHVQTYKLWLGHLRHVHNHDPDFHVTCGIGSCPATFKKFTTLYSHVYRKHRNMIEKRDFFSMNEDENVEDDSRMIYHEGHISNIISGGETAKYYLAIANSLISSFFCL